MEKLRKASVLLIGAPLALLIGLVPAGAANTVGSADIIDQSIRKVDIGPDAVGTSEIVTNGVGSAELAANSVNRSEIGAGQVGGSELGTNAVTASHIQTDAVTSSEIAATAVGSSEIATAAVGAAEIGPGAVDADEIATGAVHEAEVADDIQIETIRTYGSAGSFQLLAADLTLDTNAGSADGTDPDFLASMMGNIHGENLANDANYVGGVIGHYSVTGTNASTYPVGGVLAGVGDGTDTADGAVVAYTDGDSPGTPTTAGAAFKVMNNTSDPNSGFGFGLDLQDAGHDGYLPVDENFYLQAPLRLVRDVVFLVDDAAPTNGTTGAGTAGKGSLYFDTDNGVLYINTGDSTTPAWVTVGSQP